MKEQKKFESPIVDDFQRTVSVDEDGAEYVTWLKIDYAKLQKSLGSVKDWSLQSLLAAGINPDMPIHTGNPTRIEGASFANECVSIADELFADMNNNE